MVKGAVVPSQIQPNRGTPGTVISYGGAPPAMSQPTPKPVVEDGPLYAPSKPAKKEAKPKAAAPKPKAAAPKPAPVAAAPAPVTPAPLAGLGAAAPAGGGETEAGGAEASAAGLLGMFGTAEPEIPMAPPVGPGLRAGLGQRAYPMMNPALAGLRKIY